MSTPDPFGLVGQILDGQFRVDRFIGEGGFSVVYAGHHMGLSEPIAVKCMKLPAQLSSALIETFVQRFRDESRLHYKLSQGNLHIARTMAAGTTVSPVTRALVPYMVLEWLDGHSMATELERSTDTRTLAQVIELFETAVDALSFAQGQGVVHRDLNPGNFFLTKTVAGRRLKILDFGVAKVLDESRLEVGPRVQTMGQIRIFAPAYGAPEQFDDKLGPIGPYTDVYALALVLVEAMAGRTVMTGEHLGDFAMATLDPENRPSPKRVGLALSAEVEAVFARAFALRPMDRWPKVKDFWAALRTAARMPSARSGDEASGNATMMLATMALDGGAASGQDLAATFVDDPTVARHFPDDVVPDTARLGSTQMPAAAIARDPAPPAHTSPAPASPIHASYADPGGLALPLKVEPSPVKKGDRSQLVTLAMATRPNLPGDRPNFQGEARPPVPPTPGPSLHNTMAMPEAPRLPHARNFPAERVSYVPPEARTVGNPAPAGAAPRPEGSAAEGMRLPQPSAPGLERQTPLPAVMAPAPPQVVPPAFARDDTAPARPTSRTGLILLAGAAVAVVAVLVAIAVWAVHQRRAAETRAPALTQSSSSSPAPTITPSQEPPSTPPPTPAPSASSSSAPPSVSAIPSSSSGSASPPAPSVHLRDGLLLARKH